MTNTNKVKKLMAKELARVTDDYSDEEIINGCAFEATIEYDGKTYKATTDYTDGELEADAGEDEIVDLLDRLIKDAVENIERVDALTGEEVIDVIMTEVDESLPQIEQLQAVMDVLEDGQALENLGFEDDDQEAIEEAHDIIKKRIAEADM